MQKRKLTKEDIDKVRHIEGFPIATDEDIIALSDAPFYTACPNPFINEFIEEYGTKYDEATDDYVREPYTADVSEGKNDPIYNAHSYHTKVPHKAIMRYILHYTKPGDIVFDGFCGTGMTGVAAQVCGCPDAEFKMKIEKEMPGVQWGARRAILNDLSPAATFISYNYNTPVDVVEFEKEAKRILAEVEEECGWMYETVHTIGGQAQMGIDGNPIMGKINYTVWSDVFVCPSCASEIVYWEVYPKTKIQKENHNIICTYCNAIVQRNRLERAMKIGIDQTTQKQIVQNKQIAVLINYSVGSKRFEKKPDENDIKIIDKSNELESLYWVPDDRFPIGDKTNEPIRYGLKYIRDFYPKRILNIFSLAYKLTNKDKYIKFWINSTLPKLNYMNRYMPEHGSRALVGPMSGDSICASAKGRK